jgi:ferredoxin
MNQGNNSASANHESHQDDFQLDGLVSEHDNFSLEAEALEPSLEHEPVQESLILENQNPEQPEPSAQIDLAGMGKPIHGVVIHNGIQQDQNVSFQHAHSLLESLESQGVEVHYQCREGYCGSCRTQLLEGEVHYTEEPMAWINQDEILPCCCIPKTDIRIKLG